MQKRFLSICIPTYEMRGLGDKYLTQSFDILAAQTFKDFEVVVSDHSAGDLIKDVCGTFASKLDIKYFRNENKRGNPSANLNNAIGKAEGKLIKFLFQDDFLYYEKSLEDIVAAFDPAKDHWLVTACEHTVDGKTMYRPYYPRYTDDVHLGNNRISSPSVLTVKNENPPLFDENLIWLMDVDYYKRCYMAFGLPKVLNKINVVNRTGEHQVSNTLATTSLRQKEHDYVVKKYSQLSGS